MIFAHGETVMIKRAGVKVDPYSGAETADWSNPTTYFVPGCAVYPRFSDEPVAVDRMAVRSGFTILMPPGTDVRRTDRVSFRSVADREVDGEPFDYRHPMTGWRPGVAVNVKGVDG